MTDIMKLADDYARCNAAVTAANLTFMVQGFKDERTRDYAEARAALQSAIEALQGECAEHKENAIRNARQAVAFRAERDALQAKLDELQRQEPVKFLADATRFKTTMLANGRVLINDLPRELAGRWVAFVAAENDCHLKLAAPKALEPLTPQRIQELHEQVLREPIRTSGFFESFTRAVEAAHGITKGTPT